MRNLSVCEVPGELLENSDGTLNSELVGVLQGCHQDVEELGPLVREVPLGDGRDRIGHWRSNLNSLKSGAWWKTEPFFVIWNVLRSFLFQLQLSLNLFLLLIFEGLTMYVKGGSPGLVIMGGDYHSEGRGFESQCHILDGNFFTLICCKIVMMFVWKSAKINEKEAGDGPF